MNRICVENCSHTLTKNLKQYHLQKMRDRERIWFTNSVLVLQCVHLPNRIRILSIKNQLKCRYTHTCIAPAKGEQFEVSKNYSLTSIHSHSSFHLYSCPIQQHVYICNIYKQHIESLLRMKQKPILIHFTLQNISYSIQQTIFVYGVCT